MGGEPKAKKNARAFFAMQSNAQSFSNTTAGCKYSFASKTISLNLQKKANQTRRFTLSFHVALLHVSEKKKKG